MSDSLKSDQAVQPAITRRDLGKIAAGALATGVALKAARTLSSRRDEAIRIGGLFHMTGDGSIWGPSMKQCMELAVNQINAHNGVLGRPIELLAEDDSTSPDVAVQKSLKMIQSGGAKALFGVVYSSVRAAVAVYAARNRTPYFYPTYWEGGTSCGRYFVSAGAIPNQQLDFFIPFLMERYGPRIYCVGQDYIWPRISIDVVENLLKKHGGQLLGKEFVPFDQSDWSSIIRRIKDCVTGCFLPLHWRRWSDRLPQAVLRLQHGKHPRRFNLDRRALCSCLAAGAAQGHSLLAFVPDGARHAYQPILCCRFQEEPTVRMQS